MSEGTFSYASQFRDRQKACLGLWSEEKYAQLHIHFNSSDIKKISRPMPGINIINLAIAAFLMIKTNNNIVPIKNQHGL